MKYEVVRPEVGNSTPEVSTSEVIDDNGQRILRQNVWGVGLVDLPISPDDITPTIENTTADTTE